MDSVYECGILAQSVEHLTFNQGVGGSNPPCLRKQKSNLTLVERVAFLMSVFIWALGIGRAGGAKEKETQGKKRPKEKERRCCL